MDNPPRSVDKLCAARSLAGASSHDTRHVSPARATLNDMNTPDPDVEPELLTAGEVCKLLHIARSTLPLWRARGDLRAYKGRNGHWRYPSNQPTIMEARAALRAQVSP